MDNIPKYQQIAEDMVRHLVLERVPINGYLPTEIAWAQKFNANRLTIRRALTRLETASVVSPVVNKRRRFLGAENSATTIIGCIGYGNDDDANNEFKNLVYLRLYEHLSQEFQRHNIFLTKLVISPGTQQLPDIAYSDVVKGLLSFQSLTDTCAKTLKAPLVYLNDYYQLTYNVPVVALDGFDAGREAVRYLVGKGHRRIALACAAQHGCPFSDNVISGYQRALQELGPYKPCYIRFAYHAGQDPKAIAQIIKRVINDAPELDSMILATSNDAPAIVAALNMLNIAIPGRVSIVTIGGADPVIPGMRLTRLENDYATIARCVYEYMNELMQGRLGSIKKIAIRFYKLTEGDSVAARTLK